MKPQLLVDARCLQLPEFAHRGIGLHLTTMLSAAQADDFKVTLLFDPALQPPAAAFVALGDAATTTAYAASRGGGLLLQPAPFSLPPAPLLRHLASEQCRCIAVVLDFIPCQYPNTYLTTPRSRRLYAAQSVALRRYDHFLPISRATERQLQHHVHASIGHSDVTGVAVRRGMWTPQDGRPFAARAGVVVVSGDDPRKNPDIAISALIGVPICYVGLHDPATRARLSEKHRHAGGHPADLIFMPQLTDQDLADVYGRARLVIAPSRAEGFSLPVIEAAAQATPVLAADEPAQAELLAEDDLFHPDDATALSIKATSRLNDAAVWSAAQARQSMIADRFSEAAVAARFWPPIAALVHQPAFFVSRGAKPRIAFLSPLPPTNSGCADHSASLLAALSSIADITAYSDTKTPALPQGIRFGGPAGARVMQSMDYDAVIAVLGNSTFHDTEMRLLLDHGAAAILHDSRMIGFYRSTWGEARALGVASAECGREVTLGELDAWHNEERCMPVRFLAEIAAAASPLIVHTTETARFVAVHHGVDAVSIPFTPYRVPAEPSLSETARTQARRRLGIADGVSLIASFGHVHPGKEPALAIDAFGLIAANRRCYFALVGSGNPILITALRDRASRLGIAPDNLDLDADLVSESRYRDYLVAADVALQLRRAPPGSISGALMDTIAVGLPSVAAATLVSAIDPPAYVTQVADEAKPTVIADAVVAALERGRGAVPIQRAAFMRERNMERYARAVIAAVLR